MTEHTEGLTVVMDMAYRMAEIKERLTPARYAELDEWLWGQTRPLDETDPSDMLIYTWDYKRWLEGDRTFD